jgi:glucose/arabinose dehydrogenase
LYIQVGSNTNGGIPGPISGSQLQKENYFSSSSVVAELSNPLFDGIISYDKEDDGKPISGIGIDVFASGIRNSFSMVLHSNGYLYATDNGPNIGYGKSPFLCTAYLHGSRYLTLSHITIQEK